jgi:hypothetical protein
MQLSARKRQMAVQHRVGQMMEVQYIVAWLVLDLAFMASIFYMLSLCGKLSKDYVRPLSLVTAFGICLLWPLLLLVIVVASLESLTIDRPTWMAVADSSREKILEAV